MGCQRPALPRPVKTPLCLLFGLIVVLGLVPSPAAQTTTRGTVLIEFTGMVQGWPGSDVLTLEVKKQHVFFALHDVHSSGQRFLRERFLSDLRIRTPSMYVRGPDYLLEELLAEKPGTRPLKLRGMYYSDSRAFVMNRLSRLRDTRPER